jgi:hypothetical protein
MTNHFKRDWHNRARHWPGRFNGHNRSAGGKRIYLGNAPRDAGANLSTVFHASAIWLIIAGLTLLGVRPSRSEEEK